MSRTLTKARTTQLCADLRELRLKALAHGEGPHSLFAVITRELGLESMLCGLVAELAGVDAMRELHNALGAELSADDVVAYRARAAAQQATYLAAAAASADARTAPNKAQIRAHYELQGALADFHAAGAQA